MKVFIIITERDGETTKKPGETTTNIIKTTRRFAAESIERVWDEYFHSPDFRHETEELVAIYEEHPAIVVLDEE